MKVTATEPASASQLYLGHIIGDYKALSRFRDGGTECLSKLDDTFSSVPVPGNSAVSCTPPAVTCKQTA